MRIIALQAENLKRLVAIDIRPQGNLVQITGKNGHGKSSVLDAIWWALEGAEHIQAQPIRRGADKAFVRLDLGDLIVTRKFRGKEDGSYTTTITVENADGALFKSPQAMLDALVGELAFDPLEFARMKAKDQFDALKRFVPGVDFDAIAAANKADFDKRTDVNRRAREAGAQADGVTAPDDLPDATIDATALVNELARASEHNAEIARRKANRDAAEAEMVRKRTYAGDLRERAAALIAEAFAEESAADVQSAKLRDAPALPAPIDADALRERINAAGMINAGIEAHNKRARLRMTQLDLEAESAGLTKAINTRNGQKDAAISTATMPIDGLSFGDGCVTLRAVPFEQASDAERLRASIAIAAAMNPKLRVIRVREGSLLDDDAMAMLESFAAERDLQVWIERVDGSGKIGFVLEDGRIAGAKAKTDGEAA